MRDIDSIIDYNTDRSNNNIGVIDVFDKKVILLSTYQVCNGLHRSTIYDTHYFYDVFVERPTLFPDAMIIKEAQLIYHKSNEHNEHGVPCAPYLHIKRFTNVQVTKVDIGTNKTNLFHTMSTLPDEWIPQHLVGSTVLTDDIIDRRWSKATISGVLPTILFKKIIGYLCVLKGSGSYIQLINLSLVCHRWYFIVSRENLNVNVKVCDDQIYQFYNLFFRGQQHFIKSINHLDLSVPAGCEPIYPYTQDFYTLLSERSISIRSISFRKDNGHRCWAIQSIYSDCFPNLSKIHVDKPPKVFFQVANSLPTLKTVSLYISNIAYPFHPLVEVIKLVSTNHTIVNYSVIVRYDIANTADELLQVCISNGSIQKIRTNLIFKSNI
ncbi:hypothetical protein DFA_03950 [Cavenderia fasciculata]|uniref:F-box domain-containing protein n=1 Tax=Cavenderia fasciculata TaxID=261658 RepID=F4Q0V5_CACFS|nr:uncharacterized protein DFA_03950 [Cavenderia fasciculata]EGG18456.1 hypothetical protein DFA_03950 [Cavenderia fasciculata]|eukprot:XP_004366360.1 hypothetical protein DFA_03950 [Cavenderia fasciculata]